MMRSSLTGIVPFCLAVALLAGCSRSPRVTFYTLSATAAPASAEAVPVSAVIGPVALPATVDRPQLVVRTSPTQVDILETYRWAEPLKNGIADTIAADLTGLLPQARVTTYRNVGLEADIRIVVDVQRLEMTEGKGVALDVLWSVRPTEDGNPKTGRSVVDEPSSASGYNGLVAALDRALATVSSDIAGAVRAVAASEKQK